MHKQIWTSWILILSFLIPLVIYIKTLLPTVGFWDTGEFQTIAYTFDIAHPTGYPTYILIGKIYLSLFPFGSVAWRMNLFSALSVSLGLFVFSKLVKKLTNNGYLSILIPILLGINPYLWSIAIRADPHALHFLFTNLILFLIYKIVSEKDIKYLPIVSFLVGLSLGNHMLSIFFIPALIMAFIFSAKKIISGNKRLFFLSGVIFVLGASVYLILPIISEVKQPLTINYSLATIEGFKRHVFGEDFQGLMTRWLRENFSDSFKYYLDLVKNTFPFYLWVLGAIGFVVSLKSNLKLNITFALLFVSTIYFSLRYQNASIERYFLSSFIILMTWTAIYFGKVFKKHDNFILKNFVYLYLFACIVTNLQTNYKKIDESKNTHAYNWAKKSLSEVNTNGVIFSWWSYSTPLWYVQKVENYRPDVKIINTGSGDWEQQGLTELGERDIYFIEKIDLKDKNLDLQQIGNLYQLKKTNF